MVYHQKTWGKWVKAREWWKFGMAGNCCVAVVMEHLVTYKGIKYVPIKVITGPAKKWVTSMWFSKLWTMAIKMEKMTEKKASDVGLRGVVWHKGSGVLWFSGTGAIGWRCTGRNRGE